MKVEPFARTFIVENEPTMTDGGRNAKPRRT